MSSECLCCTHSGVIRVPDWCLLGTDRRFLTAVCFGNSRFSWPWSVAIAAPCLLGTELVSFRYQPEHMGGVIQVPDAGNSVIRVPIDSYWRLLPFGIPQFPRVWFVIRVF